MTGPDINLSVQYILNCGSEVGGSCYGGTATGAFQFMKQQGISYATCLPYLACSSDSSEGFCSHVETTCSAINRCSTCSTFKSSGGVCNEIVSYPNATIAEWGQVSGSDNVMAEVYTRGPVACGVNAVAILKYTGGIVDMPDEDKSIDHIVSVTGWGTASDGTKYW